MMFCSYKTKVFGNFLEIGEIAIVVFNKTLILSKTINKLPPEPANKLLPV